MASDAEVWWSVMRNYAPLQPYFKYLGITSGGHTSVLRRMMDGQWRTLLLGAGHESPLERAIGAKTTGENPLNPADALAFFQVNYPLPSDKPIVVTKKPATVFQPDPSVNMGLSVIPMAFAEPVSQNPLNSNFTDQEFIKLLDMLETNFGGSIRRGRHTVLEEAEKMAVNLYSNFDRYWNPQEATVILELISTEYKASFPNVFVETYPTPITEPEPVTVTEPEPEPISLPSIYGAQYVPGVEPEPVVVSEPVVVPEPEPEPEMVEVSESVEYKRVKVIDTATGIVAFEGSLTLENIKLHQDDPRYTVEFVEPEPDEPEPINTKSAPNMVIQRVKTAEIIGNRIKVRIECTATNAFNPYYYSKNLFVLIHVTNPETNIPLQQPQQNLLKFREAEKIQTVILEVYPIDNLTKLNVETFVWNEFSEPMAENLKFVVEAEPEPEPDEPEPDEPEPDEPEPDEPEPDEPEPTTVGIPGKFNTNILVGLLAGGVLAVPILDDLLKTKRKGRR